MIKLDVRTNGVELTPELNKYLQDKMDKLCRHYKTIIDAEVSLEENHNLKEATAATASAVVRVPGKDVQAKAEAKTIYAAIDELEGKLKRQLEKDKELHYANVKGRFAKTKRIMRRLFRQE
jgi:ribosomal subunit interface protein